MNDSLFFANIHHLLPHFIVIVGIVVAALWNLFSPRSKHVVPLFSLGCLVLAFVQYTGQFGTSTVDLFGKLYSLDKLSVLVGALVCAVSSIVVLMSMGYERKFGPNKGEYYTTLLTATLSVMFLAGTNDLIMLFVALETLTICCVLLAGFTKHDIRSNEASLKYLLSTAATTATFMYGLSFLYGLTGSTNFIEIQTRLYTAAQSPSLVCVVLLVLLLSVIGFKLSMVPFHMWTPDVYEGAPTPVTAFLSIGSKLGGVVVALRLLGYVFVDINNNHTPYFDWVPIVGVLAMLSMIGGNLIALNQTSVKRMLAYSSIAHVGYFLIGLCANTPDGITSMLFYTIVYGFMNLGAFAAAIMIENELGTDQMDQWSGLIRKRPWVVVGMTVCLLNLAGLPIPPAGFLSKFFVFWSGLQINADYALPLGPILVGVGLLTSVPAVFYYTRVAIKMIVKEPSRAVDALPERRRVLPDSQVGPILAVFVCLVGILVCSTYVTPLMDVSARAVAALDRTSVSTSSAPRTRIDDVISALPVNLPK